MADEQAAPAQGGKGGSTGSAGTGTDKKPVSVKMHETCISTKGAFYAGRTYAVGGAFAESLVKSGAAEKC